MKKNIVLMAVALIILIVLGIWIPVVVIPTLIAIAIVMPLSKAHELIHVYAAKKLGYKCTRFEIWKNQVEIHKGDCDGKCGDTCFTKSDPNWKKIAYAPYYYLIPVGLMFTIAGIYLFNYSDLICLGLTVGGVGTLFVNLLSIKMEGRDECQTVAVEEKQPVQSTKETEQK